MALETATVIGDLNTANPAPADGKSQGDDHIRLLKTTIKATFPGVTGVVLPTHTELNYVDGVTSAIQAQLNNKANTATTPDFTYVDNLSFSSSLPGQAGHAGETITTDGTVASWKDWAAYNDAYAPDVATAASPDIWTGTGGTKNITGTTTVTGFTAAPRAGAKRKLIAVSGFAMSNGANLTINGGSVTLAAGDQVDILAVTTTTFRADVTRADGTAVAVRDIYYDSGANSALVYTNGRHQRWAPASGAKTLTVTGWPAAGTRGELFIEGVNLASGSVPGWSGVKWVSYDGSFVTTPLLAGVTLQSVGTDFVLLWTRDGGTNVYGKVMR